MVIAVPEKSGNVPKSPSTEVPVEKPEFFRVDEIENTPASPPCPSTDFRPRWWSISHSN